MARLQILELPEGGGDDRPPFVLVIYQAEAEVVASIASTESGLREGLAEEIGARTVLAFSETIDIPANDTTAYLRDDSPADVHCQVSVGGQPVDWNRATDTQARVVQEGQRLAQERSDIARDMDRLAKWKSELTDALGMDRTRDWDDIRNAAAGIRKQRDSQAAELERLRAGEEPGADERVTPTPGQWIWHWNRATPEKRLSMAAQILAGMARSNECFMADHETQIERLRAEVERLRAERSPEE